MSTYKALLFLAAAALSSGAAGAADRGGAGNGVPGTIVEVAVNAGQFTTLVAAVQAAGLVDTLNGPGPFTVFAPTDEAFAALPPGTVESLLEPENRERLIAILTYHVVAGNVTSADVTRLDSAETVQGASLRVSTTEGGGVRINEANVVGADVMASNGVIHIVDQVILPPQR